MIPPPSLSGQEVTALYNYFFSLRLQLEVFDSIVVWVDNEALFKICNDLQGTDSSSISYNDANKLIV